METSSSSSLRSSQSSTRSTSSPASSHLLPKLGLTIVMISIYTVMISIIITMISINITMINIITIFKSPPARTWIASPPRTSAPGGTQSSSLARNCNENNNDIIDKVFNNNSIRFPDVLQRFQKFSKGQNTKSKNTMWANYEF